MERYPQLLPEAHKTETMTLLADLHALNYFSLSFPDRPQVAQAMVKLLNDRLQGDISDEYRKLLEYKLEVYVRPAINGPVLM